MKAFKRRNFIAILTSILIALPIIHILVTCLYVIFNKNAFESFGGSATLDTAFEYVISQFITENSFGNIDFFSWFSGYFLDSTSHNNLYIHFINWYLNYVLYVSISLVIFHVLYFFIDVIHNVMNKSSNLI